MRTYFSNLGRGFVSLIKGMVITFKNIFSPIVTLQYPKEKQAMTPRYRGLVDFDPEKCIMCYQCVKICPTGCLAMSHKVHEDKKKTLERFDYTMELCCFCGLCEQVCPKSAIYMNKLYEVTAYSRDKLHIDLLNPDKYAEWSHVVVK